MKLANTRFKRTLLILGSVFIIIPLLVILFISPLTKYVVEKYSVKYTGRQIKLDWAYINPFTGYVHFKNLRIYEAKSDSIFFSSEGISANFTLHKILSKTYEITNLVLDKPRGVLILNQRNNCNFTDLIKRFASKTDSTKIASPPVHFNILNVKMNAGVFYFHSILSKINYFIKDVNVESSGMRWNEDTVVGKISLTSGIGTGELNANFTINLKNMDYRSSIFIHKFSMDILAQYLKDMTNYGTLSATTDADLKATGNLKSNEKLDARGRIVINDFHFGKTPEDDYLSFDKFVFVMNEVNPEKFLYQIDSLTLTQPYFKFEEYDYLDNIETMFGKGGNNVAAVNADKKKYNLVIELAHYLIDVSKNFFQSAYKINKVALNNGDIKFNDYSRSEKFSIEATPLFISADSIYKNRRRIKVSVQSGIRPFGSVNITTSINPRDSQDFNVTTHFSKIPVAMFNPYLITFTSFPFDRGTLEFKSAWKVRKGIIQSENHILIIDPRITNRLKNKSDRRIPIWLVMYLVRERGNVIDYSIPVTGSLKNPKFHLHDVVFSILKNIFVKPPTAFYSMEVKTNENDIEKSLTLNWKMRQSSMHPGEQKFAKKIVKFLAENPAASIVITPQLYEIKEKEYILFFEAKKKYYLSINPGMAPILSERDSEFVDKMSVKDSLFEHYLNKHITHTLVFTIQDKCSNLISQALVNERFNQLNKARENTFLSCFKGKGVDNRITFSTAQNTIPYNGFSFYKIAYKGELPGYLIKAYSEMGELNNKKS